MSTRGWLFAVLAVFAAVESTLAATFTVDSTGDQGDNNIGNGTCSIGPPTNVCTLRAALQEANFTAIADTIEFNILPAGAKTIAPASLLPTITRPVTIDGTTQPGWVAAPIIELNLTAAGANGLTLNLAGSSFSTIRGLVLNRSPGNAIRILGGSTDNLIVGNYLGVDLTGTLPRANAVGVFLQTSDNRIGGAGGDRNIISGNTFDGIQINGGAGGAANNIVENNYIGVDVTGTLPVANGGQGVAVYGTNTNTLIGGTAPASMNVISGNGNDGILISTAGTTGTLVQGNRIGTNAAGTAPIPNLRGIEIAGGASGSIVGGPLGSQNVISGNTSHGILITASNNNTVSRALIGLNAAGNAKIPNGQQGVELSGGASGNTIGGVSGTGNVISGNGFGGVNVIGAGTSGNSILGNFIGLDLAGGAILSNTQNGVAIAQGATGNIVGNATGGNVISGNDQGGVRIVDNGTNNNLVQSNFIGVDVTGTLPLPNLAEGVILDTAGVATGNRIGGVGFRNVISGNGTVGVRIRNGMTGTLVVDNIIGRNATDTAGVPNGAGGVRIESSNGNTIGGTGVNDGNLIAGNNGSDGVAVVGTSTGNAILRNSIFSNTGLGIDLGDDGVTSNDVGDPDAGANGLQNFPVLSAATTDGVGNVHIAGSFNGVAAVATYRVEFFAHTSPDPSGFGEGRRYLDFANVTTDAAGYAVIGVTLAASVTASLDYVTATATDAANNTSEFARNVTVVGDLVVTTTADTVDGTTTSVAALIANPGGDGRISLREAILATNATPGADTIRFGIPLTDAGHFYYQNNSILGTLTTVAATTRADADITDFDPDYPGTQFSWYRITPTVALAATTGPVTIDGYTQPGASPNTLALGNDAVPKIELNGSLTAESVNGLTIDAINSTVQGLVINDFTDYGIRGGAAGAVIRGNFVGTNVAGTDPLGNNRLGDATGGGIALFAGGATIGGTAPSARNVVSGNAAMCARGIELWESSGNTIQGNYVGTNRAGTAAIANGCGGLVLDGTPGVGSDNNVVGGTAAGAGNVFSGNVVEGIFAQIGSDTNTIQGNIIGLNAAGTAPVPNGAQGIKLFSPGNSVGGTAAGAGNVISGNTSQGVRIEGVTSVGNAMIGNRIYSNGIPAALGIDLLGDGITSNDINDADIGPNNLLNFPFATAALESGGVLTAYFKLDVPAGSYRIEFFKNPSGADPSGNGEGENFASSVNVTHPGGGSQNFSHVFAGVVGDVITATTTFCTDGATCATFGSTSEFSNAVTAVTTAVQLISFEAIPRDEGVDLHWRTGSELHNLGFHLYRSGSASGPYDRITDAVIPGLGSSPMGKSYHHRDTGLTNGVRYFYKLEDIETTGRRELHGPVSAVPEAGDDDGDARTTYGDPGDVSFRVLERTPKGVLIELVTGGFFATRQADGTVRLEVPGFDELGGVGSPALPVKRTWLEVVAGRRVVVASVEGFEEAGLGGLRLASAGSPSVVASREGTVRAGSRRARRAVPSSGVVPASAARIVETGFQGDVKKALLELAPLRWDGARGQLLWTRRLQVRLSFAGIESSERASLGSRGRRHREAKSHRTRTVLTRLSTSKPGLYRVALADVLDSRKGSILSESLRLSHRGEPHPFHIESKGFYFLGEAESVYELELAPGGRTMPVLDGSPSGPPLSSYLRRVEWEENRYYQAGLLDAPSLWLWDVMVSPGSKSHSFSLSAMPPDEAKLEVFLQGASDFEGTDHHVRVSVNGIPVGELLWNGKAATKLEASLAPGVLLEGENELSIENAGGAGVPYSMVFLDRFAVTYWRRPIAEAGILEGSFADSGTVAVETLSPRSIVVQTSPETAWLRGAKGASFRVEAGRSYLAVSPESVLQATVRRATVSGLKDPLNRSDYLLIGPRDFLPAAEPLIQLRRGQGLLARAVAIEDVFDEFGFGEASPEALKKFIEYAYHLWMGPAPRYVVLFGDATYDRKDYLKTGVRDRVPALMLKTSYLWTASDPSYAAVNGEDQLPDLALGRLPAATVEEARVLVQKVLDYEESGQSLSGRTVLVADNPDGAGDFEADSDEIASSLSGREVEKIYLRTLGTAGTRRAIVDSFDRGASLVSYVGHGGIALWASENLFEGKDVSSLSPQASQPILLTMNCLNGYFHFPYFDALGEALVKAREKGAIAAFSPSGLSLDAPAHVYHQALMAELTSGRHARMGDAVLAAQTTYAESGFFPELLAVYNLLGDPALRIR